MRTGTLNFGLPVIAATFLLLGTSGCSVSGRQNDSLTARMSTDVASRRFYDTTISAVHPIADRVFRQYFTVDQQVSSSYEWVSQPVEVTGRGGGERVRDALAVTPNRRRQIGVLNLVQKGPHVLAKCRVCVQRLDTAERAAFFRGTGDDRPTETPIDRRGATSVLKGQDWVNVGRDRRMERLILDSLKKQFTPTK